MNLFRNVSVITDSWNNKNAFTTSRYWLEKLFLILDGYQKSRDPKKFCVKRIKYFQSDKSKSKKKELKGSIFIMEKASKELLKEFVNSQKFTRHHEQYERIVQ